MRRYALAAAIGAGLAYLFDPQSGRRRRSMARHRGLALVRRGVRQPQLDDVTLARRVETEILRGADIPKGKINVNAEEGVVVLRGEADTADMIDELVEKTRRVQGVTEVENLLHVPEKPAKTSKPRRKGAATPKPKP